MEFKLLKVAQSNLLIFFLVNTIFTSCSSPVASNQNDIDRFKVEFPNHILKYKGKNRQMGLAWSGNPQKRPLLFVHGSPGSWQGWSHFLVDTQLQKDFHILAVDRPGYGESGEGNAEFSVKAQAEDIALALQFNQSHLPAVLIGHSYGGAVIARLAMDFPNLVGGLIFVSSSVSPELEKKKWFQYPASWWPFRLLIPTSLRVCNEEIEPLKKELTAMLPLWKNINSPVIMIQGEDDTLVSPENINFLSRQLNPSLVIEIVRVPGLNHFVPWKRPDLISTAIIKVQNVL